MIDSATLAFSQVKFKKQVSVIAAGHYSLVDHERVNMIGPGSVLNQLASLYRHR